MADLQNEDGGPWTVVILLTEEGEWQVRDSYDSFDVAVEMAEEALCALRAWEAQVRNRTGRMVYHVVS